MLNNSDEKFLRQSHPKDLSKDIRPEGGRHSRHTRLFIIAQSARAKSHQNNNGKCVEVYSDGCGELEKPVLMDFPSATFSTLSCPTLYTIFGLSP